MVQIARPTSDVSTGGWEPQGSSAETTLWESVDEVSADDGVTYIEALDGEDITCELGIASTITDPGGNTGYFLKFKMQGTGSGGPERCSIALFQGATQRASSGNFTSRAAWADKVYELTTTEADSITAFTDLRIKLTSSNLGATEDMWVTQAFFEVPDVSATFTPEFNAFRFYDDAGGEAASNALAAQDININVDVFSGNVDLQLRLRCDETGGADGATTDDWQLQYDPNSTGFVNHSITDNDGIIAVAAGLIDANATTNRASEPISDPGAGSFVAGEQDDDGLINDRQLTADNFTEHAYGMRFVSANLTDGDTFDFRLSTPTGIVNNIVPRVTIDKAAGGIGIPIAMYHHTKHNLVS